ncbi:hypothetical protein [Dyadobacter sandarakinus]|uniref:Collagen-like protein n=1 Tax=Dyadobacter sandarakinus TaxID=2747268 RepID=A0ABX7ICW3_9BACT|nr:hypothetical protein [Dyadobacter sandarakinus]QRR03947.1 hypothetical protein HWI92_25050 [Dyadobacter sandarakinus]
MNKKLIPLLLVLVALFQGCRGPEGPPGPQGQQGTSTNVTGTTFDFVDVDFTTANDFQVSLSFDDADIEVLESDAVLVYINWGDVKVGTENLPAYRLLTQTAFLTNGILTYNFDRTRDDLSVFLDGTVNRATVASSYTTDQSFRVVVIPADFAARTSGQVDYSDYNAVVKQFNIDESKIVKIKAK